MRKDVKTIVINEPHVLLEGGNDVSLTQYRMFQLVIGNIFIKEGLAEDKLYEIPIDYYAEIFNISKKAAYISCLQAVKDFGNHYLNIKETIFDENASNSARILIHWFDKIVYNPDSGVIQVRFARDLVALYNRLGEDIRYSKYLLENTYKMTSFNSVKLFRLLNKWVVKGGICWKLEEFKQLMGFKKDEYELVDNLRRWVIVPSLADINKFTDLEVEEIKDKECKEGRRIVKVKFGVRRKERVGLANVV